MDVWFCKNPSCNTFNDVALPQCRFCGCARGTQFSLVEPNNTSTRYPEPDIVRKWRKETRKISLLYGYAGLCALVCISFSAMTNWLLPGKIALVGLIVTVLTAITSWPRLYCPKCERPGHPSSLENRLKKFCPSCGHNLGGDGQVVLLYRFGPTRKCTSCDSRLERGSNGRSFKIRFCTYCSAKLSDKGI